MRCLYFVQTTQNEMSLPHALHSEFSEWTNFKEQYCENLSLHIVTNCFNERGMPYKSKNKLSSNQELKTGNDFFR